MNYTLSPEKMTGTFLQTLVKSARGFAPFIRPDSSRLIGVGCVVVLNSVAGILTPFMIAYSIDTTLLTRTHEGLARNIGLLVALYLVTVVTGFLQPRLMGRIAQQTLYRLRAALFEKLQRLPIAFFNANRAGDLMSRINNDADKLGQFLSETVVRFVGMFFVIFGIGIFIFFLNVKLALVMLSLTAVVLGVTRCISPWIQKNNVSNLTRGGGLSAHVQESVSNFKVIVAYNRQDYFREKFREANAAQFKAAFWSDLSNEIFRPLYDFANNTTQLLVLLAGLYLVVRGELTVGLLVGFFGYAQRFYDPLRILGSLWAQVQTSVAAWTRIQQILLLESNLLITEKNTPRTDEAQREDELLSFSDVTFGYGERPVLEHISFQLMRGKTYALVGPTGGGKSTTAALMVRLYDPWNGSITFAHRDIRSFSPHELSQDIGFIVQEPFLFTGTVADNIRYGNHALESYDATMLSALLDREGLKTLLEKFDHGLDTVIHEGAENISLGQKQLIAFIRIVLRKPKLLILDEATANIDTVTEQILEDILGKLPSSTTKVIIAHRLNTIKDADEIMFISGGHIQKAGDFHAALALIEKYHHTFS